MSATVYIVRNPRTGVRIRTGAQGAAFLLALGWEPTDPEVVIPPFPAFSGYIDADELQAALDTIGMGLTPAQVRSVIAADVPDAGTSVGGAVRTLAQALIAAAIAGLPEAVTPTQLASALSPKANAADVTAALVAKADASALAGKVNTSTYTAGMVDKQDKATLGADVAASPAVRAASVSAVQDAIAAGTIVVGGGSAPSLTRALPILRAGLANRLVSPCRVVFAGSSTVAGQNATAAANRFVNRLVSSLQAAYPSGLGSETVVVANNNANWGAVSTAAGVHGYNAGQGGLTSATYLDAGEMTRVGALNPRMVLHMIGSNDREENVPVATYKGNMLAKINGIKAAMTGPCVHVLVQSYPKNNGSGGTYPWADYGKALAELAAADPTSVAFIDLSDAYAQIGIPGADPLAFLDTDQVHQLDAGHAFMADLLRERMGVQPVATSAAAPADTTAPTVPTNLSAAAGNGQVTLSWTASTDAVGVTKYRVRRGGTVIAEPTGTSYADTGLTNGTQYSYTVSALDAAGNESAQTAAATATPTAAQDTTAPTAPTSLAAGTPTASAVPLSWTASTDNVAVTGYRVYRGSTLATTVTGTSATVTGLTASTAYAFTVRAIDAAGNESTDSNAVNVTTAAGATPFLNDTVTGTDGVLMSAHTPETGGTYVKQTTSGDMTIVGAQGRAYVSAATAMLRSPATPPSANYTVTAGIDFLTVPTSGVSIGPVARMTTSGAGYAARYDYAAGQWRIDRLSGGATGSTKATFTQALSVGHKEAGIRVGDAGALTLILDGVDVATGTDTSPITAAGFAGVIGATAASATTGSQLTTLAAA